MVEEEGVVEMVELILKLKLKLKSKLKLERSGGEGGKVLGTAALFCRLPGDDDCQEKRRQRREEDSRKADGRRQEDGQKKTGDRRQETEGRGRGRIYTSRSVVVRGLRPNHSRLTGRLSSAGRRMAARQTRFFFFFYGRRSNDSILGGGFWHKCLQRISKTGVYIERVILS